MTQPAYSIVVWIVITLLFEGGILFFIIRYYRKKLKQQQERFAGYLKYLDEQNERLKKQIARSSNMKLQPKKARELTL